MKRTFCIVFFFIVSQNLFASASVFYLKGNVKIQRDSSLLNAKKGDEILDGDHVLTGTDSLCIIQYSGNSKVKIDPESNFVFELIDTPLEEDENLYNKIKLITGSIVIDHPNERKTKELEVEVESVSFGVRGTKFFIGIDQEKGNDVYMNVQEGVVEALNYKENDSEEVRSGRSVVVESGKKLTKADKFDWQKDLNYSFDPKKKYLRSMFASKKLRAKRRSEFLAKRKNLRKRTKRKIQQKFIKRRQLRKKLFERAKRLDPKKRRELFQKIKNSRGKIRKKINSKVKETAKKRIQNRRDKLRKSMKQNNQRTQKAQRRVNRKRRQ